MTGYIISWKSTESGARNDDDHELRGFTTHFPVSEEKKNEITAKLQRDGVEYQVEEV